MEWEVGQEKLVRHAIAKITPFELEILLETGGLEPGEYNVVVNNTASATFMIQ